jgi:hypothetical protein
MISLYWMLLKAGIVLLAYKKFKNVFEKSLLKNFNSRSKLFKSVNFNDFSFPAIN